MYTAFASALPFKDKCFQSQVPTCASTFVCTSDQFHSSWMSSLNHTPRMQMGPSFQQKGSGRGTPPLQEPSCRPSLLLKLTLAPAITPYLETAFFTASIFEWQDTKTVISSVKVETLALTCPTKTPIGAGFAFSSMDLPSSLCPCLRSRGSKARM